MAIRPKGTEMPRARLIRDALATKLCAPEGAPQPAERNAGKSNKTRTTEKERDKEISREKDRKENNISQNVHQEGNDDIKENRENEKEQEEEIAVFNIQNDENCKMAYIMIKTDEGKNLIGLIDTGANCCLISEEAANKCNLEIDEKVKMRLKGVGSDEVFETNIYNIPVYNHLIKAKGYNKLNTTTRIQKIEDHEFKRMKDMGIDTSMLKKLNKCEGRKVDMIIGTNVLWQIWKKAKVRTINQNKSVVCTDIGNFVIPTTTGSDKRVTDSSPEVFNSEDWYSHMCDTENTEEEYDELKAATEKLWNLNVLGIQDPDTAKEEMSQIEEAMAEFKRTAKWEDGKLLVKLPMNGNEVHLDDNLPVAMKRLVNQVYKLAPNEEALKEYDEIINKQRESKFIEECTNDPEKGKCFYIPQQAVFKTDSNTTKIRIVLDASSHGAGKLSLNQCMKTMPSMVKLLTGILLRSRTGKFYMTSDIEKAFHQIRLQEEDRDYTRFVWLKDISKGPVAGNFVTYRFTRIPFGMSCSPFLLAASILTYMEKYPADINAQMGNNMYVDNLMFLTNIEAELPEMYLSSKAAAHSWGMNLRQYQSNSKKVRQYIPDEDKAPDKPNKMLGMMFDAVKDTMTIGIPSPPEGRPTKKQLQSFLARIYDPMGVLAPLTVRLKQFLQSLWETKIGWKQTIPKDTMPIWESIKKDFQHTEYTMQRQLTERYDYKAAKLIVFSDASKNNYGIAAYMRFEFPDKSTKISLLMAKSRVKPLKGSERLTIPRLELLALAVATNCAVYLHKEIHQSIPFESVEFFSDSMIALGWTTTKKSLKCFVNNKVRLIKDNCKLLTDLGVVHQLHYVPTEENPADMTTRGKSSTELFASKLWHNGPEFLTKSKNHWPQQWKDSTIIPRWLAKAMSEEIVGKEGKLVYEEEDGIHEYVIQLTTATADDVERTFQYESVVPYESAESLKELMDNVENTLKVSSESSKNENVKDKLMEMYLSAKPGIEGYEQRRKAVLYYLIRDHYWDTASRKEYRISQDIRPMQDQYGLIRVGTRLDKSDLPENTKFPIVLVKDHKLTELIVQDIHIRNKHIGTEHLLAESRKLYWIPQGRQLARRVINSCFECRKLRGRPFRYPEIPPLPASRVNRSKPFENIGLDYFGPLHYKGNTAPQKCWVLICTCLVTRNVHLELVSDNGTLEFILAMRRFFARRGTPKTVVLDNAKTFILGEKIFNGDIRRMAEECETFTTFLDQNPMDWKFITPLSPWKGGIYERIIGIVKKLLYASGDTEQFNFVQLFTIITEIEGIVNSRPISYNSESASDNQVMRPADFIIPNVQLGILQDERKDDWSEMSQTEMITREHMCQMNRHMSELWKQWEDSYLTQLKEAKKKAKHYTIAIPKVGQRVLVQEQLTARHKWPVAKITQTHPNENGQIRTVTVRLDGKDLKRSVNQLIPLELDPEDPATKVAVMEPNENSSQTKSEPNTDCRTESVESEDERQEDSVREAASSREDRDAHYNDLRTRQYLPRRAKEGIVYCDLALDQSEKMADTQDQDTHKERNKDKREFIEEHM